MAVQLVKNQHFIPRTYLKHFSQKKGDNYLIKAIPKSNPVIESVIERNTKSICFQKHLYTLPGTTVEEKMLIEKFYSDEFERHYNEIYEMLTDPQKKQLSEDERKLIIGTVTTMFYRVPVWIKKHNDLMRRVYHEIFNLTMQTGKEEFTFEGEKISVKGKTLEQFLEEKELQSKPNQVITQLETALKLIPLRMANDNIFIVKLEDDDSEFITSDNPVVQQNIHGGKIMPFDVTNIMKLPLDNKHILMLMPFGEKNDRHIIARNSRSGIMCKREAVISNHEIFQQSDVYILGSDSSLEKYLKIKNLAESSPRTDENGQFTDDYIKELKDNGLI